MQSQRKSPFSPWVSVRDLYLCEKLDSMTRAQRKIPCTDRGIHDLFDEEYDGVCCRERKKVLSQVDT